MALEEELRVQVAEHRLRRELEELRRRSDAASVSFAHAQAPLTPHLDVMMA